MMPRSVRALSATITTIPAFFWSLLAVLTNKGDYLWPTYLMVCGILLTASLLLGLALPAIFDRAWRKYPGRWVFIQGGLAWVIALAALALLNLTPLCIGQNNGEGTNDISVCMLQTGLVAVVYSPLELFLLVLSAIGGGWLIQSRLRKEKSPGG